MDEKPVTADVVVACLFAGVGAWGATVTVGPNPMYASELFGAGHAAISYPTAPTDMTPVVTLSIPQNAAARAAAGADTTDDATDDRDQCSAVNHDGSAEVTFSLLAGAFDGNVTGLMWDPLVTLDATGADISDQAGVTVAAPAAVASIESGGRKGDSSITIKIEEVPSAAASSALSNDLATRAGGAYTRNEKGCAIPNFQRISFRLPKLAGLEALAGANIADGKKDNDEKTVWARAESRIISGSFTDGLITGAAPHHVVPVVKARDSITLDVEASDDGMKTIALKDDADKGLMAFKSVKEKNKDGYVELATVTVTTKQESVAAMGAMKSEPAYTFNDGSADRTINTIGKGPSGAKFHELHDLDGEPIDEGLRGTLTVNAMGTRDLFNDGDLLFIDYDRNGKMGSGEAIDIDGAMGMGDALSVDPNKSDSFDAGGTGVFKVYYMPGGKDAINHGSMINLTAMVDYSDPTAIDEVPMKSGTTLNFDGVTSEVDAYAIPFDGNGKGDKANVRVRCEAAAGCRVFLECWDDMGMRSFGGDGEPIMIDGNALATWNAMDIEGVIGLEEATSRHSCRILSTGKVTVQQLTRDGTSGTLVNNTYIGE